MSSADGRARLEAEQADLVRALTGQGKPPPGFAVERVQAAAASLLRKRQRAAALAWPRLAAALGERFAEQFLAFAQKTQLPSCGGALADGRAFARELMKTDSLSEEGKLEVLAIDL